MSASSSSGVGFRSMPPSRPKPGHEHAGLVAGDDDVRLERPETALDDLPAEGCDRVVRVELRRPRDLPGACARRPAVRPVERDRLAGRAAEELRDRDAERLSFQVEQRVLDPADRFLDDRAGALAGAAVAGPSGSPRRRAGRARRRAARDPARRPARPVGEPCESVTSDQPTRPSSVVALTNSHGRQPASQASVSSEASFTIREDTARARRRAASLGPRRRAARRARSRPRRRC